MVERIGADDRAVRAIAAAVEGCASSEEALTYLREARARLTPRLEVMRRHKREPGMATYVEQLVTEIDEAIAAGFGPATPVALEDR